MPKNNTVFLKSSLEHWIEKNVRPSRWGGVLNSESDSENDLENDLDYIHALKNRLKDRGYTDQDLSRSLEEHLKFCRYLLLHTLLDSFCAIGIKRDVAINLLLPLSRGGADAKEEGILREEIQGRAHYIQSHLKDDECELNEDIPMGFINDSDLEDSLQNHLTTTTENGDLDIHDSIENEGDKAESFAHVIWIGPFNQNQSELLGIKSLNHLYPEQDIRLWVLDEYVGHYASALKDKKNITIVSVEIFLQKLGIVFAEGERLLDVINKFIARADHASKQGNKKTAASNRIVITNYLKVLISVFQGGWIFDSNIIHTIANVKKSCPIYDHAVFPQLIRSGAVDFWCLYRPPTQIADWKIKDPCNDLPSKLNSEWLLDYLNSTAYMYLTIFHEGILFAERNIPDQEKLDRLITGYSHSGVFVMTYPHEVSIQGFSSIIRLNFSNSDPWVLNQCIEWFDMVKKVEPPVQFHKNAVMCYASRPWLGNVVFWIHFHDDEQNFYKKMTGSYKHYQPDLPSQLHALCVKDVDSFRDVVTILSQFGSSELWDIGLECTLSHDIKKGDLSIFDINDVETCFSSSSQLSSESVSASQKGLEAPSSLDEVLYLKLKSQYGLSAFHLSFFLTPAFSSIILEKIPERILHQMCIDSVSIPTIFKTGLVSDLDTFESSTLIQLAQEHDLLTNVLDGLQRNYSHVDFRGADLSSIDIGDANMNDMIIDSTTMFKQNAGYEGVVCERFTYLLPDNTEPVSIEATVFLDKCGVNTCDENWFTSNHIANGPRVLRILSNIDKARLDDMMRTLSQQEITGRSYMKPST